MVDNPDASGILVYVLLAAVGALSTLVAYIWRSHVITIEKLQSKVESVEKAFEHYATKSELNEHSNRTESLLREIRTDLRSGFQTMNERIDYILRGGR